MTSRYLVTFGINLIHTHGQLSQVSARINLNYSTNECTTYDYRKQQRTVKVLALAVIFFQMQDHKQQEKTKLMYLQFITLC